MRVKWMLLFNDSAGVLQLVGNSKCNPLTKREAKHLLNEYARHLPTLWGQMLPVSLSAIVDVPRKKRQGQKKPSSKKR